MKMDRVLQAWTCLFVLAMVGTIVALLIGIWWNGDVAMKLWLSTMAITLMPIWILSGF